MAVSLRARLRPRRYLECPEECRRQLVSRLRSRSQEPARRRRMFSALLANLLVGFSHTEIGRKIKVVGQLKQITGEFV
jgi:hypothetical protein